LKTDRSDRDEHERAVTATSDTREGTDAHGGPPVALGVGHDSGPPLDAPGDPVELGILNLMNRAADAGEWDVVRELAAQLEARRKARTGIVDLGRERSRRGKS
jgi:hypothetical protein